MSLQYNRTLRFLLYPPQKKLFSPTAFLVRRQGRNVTARTALPVRPCSYFPFTASTLLALLLVHAPSPYSTNPEGACVAPFGSFCGALDFYVFHWIIRLFEQLHVHRRGTRFKVSLRLTKVAIDN